MHWRLWRGSDLASQALNSKKTIIIWGAHILFVEFVELEIQTTQTIVGSGELQA